MTVRRPLAHAGPLASDSPPDNTPDPAPSWLPLKAAAERLGLSPDGLLKRIRRGHVQAQRDNRGKWQVRVDALSEADKSKRPRTVRPDRADLEAQIAALEAERQAERARLEADLHAARKAFAGALSERDRLMQHVHAARSETASAVAKAELRAIELSGSIRQLSETLSGALSEAKAREARVLSEAEKARSEADKAAAELALARQIIADLRALPWWRRLLGR